MHCLIKQKKSNTLADKIALSRKRLRRIFSELGPDKVAVAWTGGKDSTAALKLWADLAAESGEDARLRALSIDTGLKFPETRAFRDRLAREWEIELVLAGPEVDLDVFPVAKDKVQCCKKLKIEPLQKAMRETGLAALITGIRADEHPGRAALAWQEYREDPGYLEINPILHWTEMDVWSFHMFEGVPYCELYDQGYRSLGCIPCTGPCEAGADERSGRDREKEQQLEQLRSLGYF